MAKVLGKVPLRLKQALAFPTKFPFLFSKLTFHFTIIIVFPKKLMAVSWQNRESWQVWNTIYMKKGWSDCRIPWPLKLLLKKLRCSQFHKIFTSIIYK